MAVREVMAAELVDCPECGATPYVRCTSPSGINRKPHGKRIARLHGLKACPQRGSFGVPREGGLQYRDDEIKATSERGISLPVPSEWKEKLLTLQERERAKREAEQARRTDHWTAKMGK